MNRLRNMKTDQFIYIYIYIYIYICKHFLICNSLMTIHTHKYTCRDKETERDVSRLR